MNITVGVRFPCLRPNNPEDLGLTPGVDPFLSFDDTLQLQDDGPLHLLSPDDYVALVCRCQFEWDKVSQETGYPPLICRHTYLSPKCMNAVSLSKSQYLHSITSANIVTFIDTVDVTESLGADSMGSGSVFDPEEATVDEIFGGDVQSSSIALGSAMAEAMMSLERMGNVSEIND